MAGSALGPVSEAIYAVLQDAALQAATTGGWHDTLPQPPVYPCGFFDVQESEARGLGTGGLPQIDLRLHTLSGYDGKAEALAINRLVVALFKDRALVVDGYAMCDRVFFDETLEVDGQVLNSVPIFEVVSSYHFWVEEA